MEAEVENKDNAQNKSMTLAVKESRRPLDWQMTKQNLSERGQYLLETGIWSDCTFVVGLPPNIKVSFSSNYYWGL